MGCFCKLNAVFRLIGAYLAQRNFREILFAKFNWWSDLIIEPIKPLQAKLTATALYMEAFAFVIDQARINYWFDFHSSHSFDPNSNCFRHSNFLSSQDNYLLQLGSIRWGCLKRSLTQIITGLQSSLRDVTEPEPMPEPGPTFKGSIIATSSEVATLH